MSIEQQKKAEKCFDFSSKHPQACPAAYRLAPAKAQGYARIVYITVSYDENTPTLIRKFSKLDDKIKLSIGRPTITKFS